jgi:hypothetical protein
MPQPVKISGTLIAANQNGIQISTSANQKILVGVRPDTQVSVTGTAEQDYLKSKSKLTVEFVGEVDKGEKGGYVVKDKIDKLLIVSPTADRPLGLSPADAATPDKKDEKGPKTKEKANPLGGDPLAGKPAKGRSSVPQIPGTFTVRGTVKMGKNGLMTVATGRWTIKATLADDATIDVDLADISVARPDDQVTASGRQVRPDAMMAESITIEMANPLTGKKHKTSAGKTSAPKAKKGTGDDAAGGGK